MTARKPPTAEDTRRRIGKARVRLLADPAGVLHAYLRCPAAPALAGQTASVAVLAAQPAARICACLQHRWAAYRADLRPALGLAA